MNASYLIGASFGGAAAMTLIAFPVVAIAVQSRKKAKLGWGAGLLHFLLAVLIATAVNFATYSASPVSLTPNDFDTMSLVRTFVIPFVASAAVLFFLWRPSTDVPKPDQPSR